MKGFILSFTLMGALMATRPTFINIQTTEGTIHYPTIISASDTDVIMAGGNSISLMSINRVLAYGASKPLLPILSAVGCGYLGYFPGCLLGIIVFPEVMSGDSGQSVGFAFMALSSAILSGRYAYLKTKHKITEKNKTTVFMGGWSLEQKRDFFKSVLTPI